MKSLLTNLLPLILILTLCFQANAQTPAWDRAAKIEKGYNLAGWLEAIWLGGGYPDPTAYTEHELITFAELGFKTVRVPVSYEWVFTQHPPYDTILNQSVFDIIDSTIIPIAEQYKLTVIFDNHHGRELSNTNFEDEIPRICEQWKFLTQYYANLPHDRYFFELRHQAGDDINNENLRIVQQAIIDTIRNYDTERTLITGANWWSAPFSLTQTTPYNDDNIIYSFLSYYPQDFTHQGLSWVEPYIPTGITFSESSTEANDLRNSLIEVKNWSQTHNVPIFWKEFGVSWFADAQSRCNYIEFTTRVADSLDIPWIYWDIKNAYDAFGIFDGEIHQDNIISCFRNAMGLLFVDVESPEVPIDIAVSPNPIFDKSNLNIQLEENRTGYADLMIMDVHGRVITNQKVYVNSGIVSVPTEDIPINKLTSGIYFVYLKSEKWQSKLQKLMYLH